MGRARSFVLLTAAALTACGASGPQFLPELIRTGSETSTIVVYRLSQSVGRAYTAEIVLDGKTMGRLRDGGYIRSVVPPGQHVIEIDKAFFETGGRNPTKLNTVAGQAYFVRYDPSAKTGSYMHGKIHLDGISIVPQDQALRELQALKESR